MKKSPDRDLAAIAVVYGDPVVGQALALLLRGSDYGIRQVPVGSLQDPAFMVHILEGVVVVVLAPGIDAGLRDTFLERLREEERYRRISVLELGTPPEGARHSADYSARWPSGTEDIKQRIERMILEGNSRWDSPCNRRTGSGS